MRQRGFHCCTRRCSEASTAARVRRQATVGFERRENEGTDIGRLEPAPRRDNDHVLFGDDPYPLTTAALCFKYGAEVREYRWSPILVNPEAVAVFRRVRVGLRRRVQITCRHYLPAFPHPPVEPQIADSCHIARPQVKIAPAIGDPIWIGGPRGITNAERGEQLLLRKRKCATAGNFGDDTGEHVHAAATVHPGTAWVVRHG